MRETKTLFDVYDGAVSALEGDLPVTLRYLYDYAENGMGITLSEEEAELILSCHKKWLKLDSWNSNEFWHTVRKPLEAHIVEVRSADLLNTSWEEVFSEIEDTSIFQGWVEFIEPETNVEYRYEQDSGFVYHSVANDAFEPLGVIAPGLKNPQDVLDALATNE